MLDEPTNHLDTTKKDLLRSYLNKKKGFIIVSHDMAFLDKVVDHICSINRSDITIEQGNYTTWKANFDLKEQYELRTKEKLLREIHQLERNATQTRNWGNAANKQKYECAGNFRTNGAQSYMRQAKKAEAHITENLEEKKKLLRNMEKTRHLKVIQDTMTNKLMLSVEDLCFSYEGSDRLVLNHFYLQVESGERIWIRGRNGAGKSTLLQILSGQLEGSARVRYTSGLNLAYSTQEPKWTRGSVRELFFQEQKGAGVFDKEELQSTYMQFRGYCFRFHIPADFERRPIETLSSGEKKKLDISLALCMPNQLLLLDEPLNFMDVNFREQLTEALCESNATVLFVEHNEEFGEKTATRIVDLSETTG